MPRRVGQLVFLDQPDRGDVHPMGMGDSTHDSMVKSRMAERHCIPLDIDSLAGYMRTNRHLPGAISGEEYEAGQRMSLGELSQGQTEAIELLFVHLIEANERIQTPEAVIESLPVGILGRSG